MKRLGSLDVLAGRIGDPELERIGTRRDTMEWLRERADLLCGADRALVRMYLEAGSTFYQLAQLVGRNRSSVCRRIHRLIRRLSDETYRVCQRCPHLFDGRELAVVRDHFVRGVSLRRISRDHQLGYYRVRRIVEKARRLARATKTA
ncbi:MAG: hypothetical protein MUC88_28615 [Planctomycetes bacterium]|jgi:hypothetical protein|nr:hypothetical protein [Planctomycetota bacterium]